MFWRVANTQLHIFGSVHVLSEPPAFLEHEAHALENAGTIALEANFEVPGNPRLGLYSGSRSLRDDISHSLYEETQAIWSELNLPVQELDRTRPWKAAFRIMSTILPQHGYQHGFGVDATALNIAKTTHKSIFHLETRDAGEASFASAPMHEQEEILVQAVRRKEEGLSDIRNMIEAWTERAPNSLNYMYEKCMLQAPRAYKAALVDRNRIWTPKLLRLARSGRTAIAVVGALHMLGPTSLPVLLGKAGYKCELAHAL